MKQVKAIPQKITVVGIGILFTPFFISIFRAPENIATEALFAVAAMSVFIFLSIVTDRNIWVLFKCHKLFFRHYIYAHLITAVSTIFLPFPNGALVAIPLGVYIGWYSVECEREIINKYETNDG